MRKTKLVTMHASLNGWMDTGATSLAITVARHNYEPEGPIGKRLTEREEIVGYTAEIFLSEMVEQDITNRLLKAFSEYSTALLLP